MNIDLSEKKNYLIDKYIWIDIKTYLFDRYLWHYPERIKFSEIINTLPKKTIPHTHYNSFVKVDNQKIIHNSYFINNFEIYEYFRY